MSFISDQGSSQKKMFEGFGFQGLPLILGISYASLTFITGMDSFRGLNSEISSPNYTHVCYGLVVGTLH